MPAHQKRNIGDMFAQAMQAFEAGRTTEARRLAQQMVQDRPDFGGGHYLSGLLALDQGQARRAAASLARAIAITPDQPVLHLAMAQALEQEGETAQAVTHYRTVLNLETGHAEAHARLAELLGRLGKNAQALDHARHAVTANPAHAEAWNTLGALELSAGRPAQAIDALRHALEIRPDWPAALNHFGMALTDIGHFEQAVTILEGAVELMPSKSRYRANLAAALRLGGQLDQARIQAERATRCDSRNPDTWTELGLARQAQNHQDGAAAAFERAIALAPHLVSAQFGLAEACRALGQTQRAAAAYGKCLELDPTDRHGAALGLSLALDTTPPPAAPEAYVRELFDEYAEDFDRFLVEGLSYRAPAEMARALEHVLTVRSGLSVLDGGCGTGLMAPVLRKMAARLDGVDLSPAMVAKAVERGLYDEACEGELVATLTDRPGRYDLITAADVLVYMGDLAPLMAAAHRALTPGGSFAFTAERSESAPYELGPKNRYRHTPDYVRETAEAAGFRVALLEDAEIRREAGHADPHMVAVLSRS